MPGSTRFVFSYVEPSESIQAVASDCVTFDRAHLAIAHLMAGSPSGGNCRDLSVASRHSCLAHRTRFRHGPVAVRDPWVLIVALMVVAFAPTSLTSRALHLRHRQ